MSQAPAPRISLIVAASLNGVIGVDGDLPWRLPDDLKHFKRLTLGKPVVMGRRTFESIGRALPDRQNIVLSSRDGFEAEGCTVVSSPDAAIAAAGGVPEIMIIGGASLYETFLPIADRIYLTRVHATLDGDTVFDVPEDGWQAVASERHAADERHEYAFEFLTLERRPVRRALQSQP